MSERHPCKSDMLSRALHDTKFKSGSVTTPNKPHCTGLIFRSVLNSFPQSSFCRSPCTRLPLSKGRSKVRDRISSQVRRASPVVYRRSPLAFNERLGRITLEGVASPATTVDYGENKNAAGRLTGAKLACGLYGAIPFHLPIQKSL